jgi:hypothetical protein
MKPRAKTMKRMVGLLVVSWVGVAAVSLAVFGGARWFRNPVLWAVFFCASAIQLVDTGWDIAAARKGPKSRDVQDGTGPK